MSLSTYTMGGSERTEQNRIELSLEVRKCLVAALVHFTLCTRLCTRTPHQVSSSLVLVVNWYWSLTGTGHHGIFSPLPSSLRHHLGTHLNYRNTHTQTQERTVCQQTKATTSRRKKRNRRMIWQKKCYTTTQFWKKKRSIKETPVYTQH